MQAVAWIFCYLQTRFYTTEQFPQSCSGELIFFTSFHIICELTSNIAGVSNNRVSYRCSLWAKGCFQRFVAHFYHAIIIPTISQLREPTRVPFHRTYKNIFVAWLTQITHLDMPHSAQRLGTTGLWLVPDHLARYLNNYLFACLLTHERHAAAPARAVVLVQNRHLVGSARVTLNFRCVKSKPLFAKILCSMTGSWGKTSCQWTDYLDSSDAALSADQRARGLRRRHCKVFVF